LATDTIDAIVEGLEEFWSTASSTVSGWWDSLEGWFTAQDWGALGQAIIDGIVAAVSAGGAALGQAAAGAAQGAIGAAKAALGIASPSKVFYEIGENVVKGFVNAIHANHSEPKEAIEEMFNVAGTFASVGSTMAKRLKDNVFPAIGKDDRRRANQL
jgi:hypothetical protein